MSSGRNTQSPAQVGGHSGYSSANNSMGNGSNQSPAQWGGHSGFVNNEQGETYGQKAQRELAERSDGEKTVHGLIGLIPGVGTLKSGAESLIAQGWATGPAQPGQTGDSYGGGNAGSGNGGGYGAPIVTGPTPAQLAQAQAEQAAQAKAVQQRELIDKINSTFGGADYSKMRGDIYNYHMNDVNQQKQQAERALRFALARSGQLGGSLDVDQNAQLGDDYNKASTRISSLADSAVNQTRSANDQIKNSLISSAQSGQDVQASLNEAGNRVNSSINAAKDAATANAVGQVFNVLGNQYDKQQFNAGMGSITKPQTVGTTYSSPGYNGTVTRS